MCKFRGHLKVGDISTLFCIINPEGLFLRDEIEFDKPGCLWFLGKIAAPFAVFPKLEKMFAYRHEITRKWCETE